jgi:hypothetical protein
MFHKFEPLEQRELELTPSLEDLVQRGENIPPQRIFGMVAGEKTIGLNAYVKRIVVWDTTIAKMSAPKSSS